MCWCIMTYSELFVRHFAGYAGLERLIRLAAEDAMNQRENERSFGR